MGPMIAFGPVPSRRLGRSLAINNIPAKMCTYSCVCCQPGRTSNMRVERRPFYRPLETLRSACDKVWNAEEAGEPVDYLTFVPDGEPTLGIPIAVITNASLTWRQDVRGDLMQADWVSLRGRCRPRGDLAACQPPAWPADTHLDLRGHSSLQRPMEDSL
jgi:wyosine [tRNA(Phe)-imidazoG37] synthetase (radical SAM superfamily)